MDEELRPKLRSLRDRLAAAAPRLQIRADAPAELRRAIQSAQAQVDGLLRALLTPSKRPDNFDEAVEDLVAEATLLLHQCERLAATKAKLAPSGSERRQHERTAVDLQVRLLRHALRSDDSDHALLTTETVSRPARNISTGGIFVTLPRGELSQVDVGSIVHVQVTAPGGSIAFQARASVARRTDGGVGLSWILDSDKTRRDVSAFVDGLRDRAAGNIAK
jgi:hypothetical protein